MIPTTGMFDSFPELMPEMAERRGSRWIAELPHLREFPAPDTQTETR
ncbi:MAG: hypothetical protein MK106_12520 [Mariniblastus sp.]|nr:hypothetical protein [Mariniblastus sp.]